MIKKIMRGISREFVDAFNKSDLKRLYDENKRELFLGIRNGYINLYYKGASISKVQLRKGATDLACSVSSKYIDSEVEKNSYTTLSPAYIYNDYKIIKDNIAKLPKNTDEKIAQQQLVNNNNSNPDSNWYCIDIEYSKQRNNSKEQPYGRFDIIALSKTYPHSVALIELKYGGGTIGGKSGIVGHAKDFACFNRNNIYDNHLKSEIVDIVQSLKMIDGSIPLDITGEKDLADQPSIYFIILNNQNDDVKRKVRRYLYDNEPKASSKTVESLKIKGVTDHLGDIADPLNEQLYAQFLFSDVTLNNNIIEDIIESDLYSKGLELSL